jgi:hypothetical protein
VRTGKKQQHGKGWKYTDFEASFLTFVKELDLKSIMSDQQQDIKRNEFDQEIASLAGKIAINDKRRDNILELYEGGAKEATIKKLNDLQQAAMILQTDIEAKRKQRAELDVRFNDLHAMHAEIKDIIDRLQAKNGDYRSRAEVAQKIKSLVEKIDLASGDCLPNQKTVPHVITFPPILQPMLQKNLRKVPNRYFMVQYKATDAYLTVVTFHPVNENLTKIFQFGWSPSKKLMELEKTKNISMVMAEIINPEAD